MTESIEEKVRIFGGSLQELNSLDQYKQYYIAGNFFRSRTHSGGISEERLQKEVRAKGYDGIIRAGFHSTRFLLLVSSYYTGVPIKLKPKSE